MLDARRFADYLAIALVSVGCGKGEPSPPPTPAKRPVQPDAELPVNGPPQPPIDAYVTIGSGSDYKPSCQHATWCETPAVVMPLQKGAIVGACPEGIADYGPDAKPTVKPASYPPSAYDVHLKPAESSATKCCYDYSHSCMGGRPLLVDDAPQLAPAPTVDDPRAARWLAEARAEHASIASFARAALELMAVGAPTHLLDEVAAAMRDEVRHARACFDLAARYAGRELVPGPLPAAAPRVASIVQVACDTFREGCVNETIATLAMARELAACSDPELVPILEMIVADETRHAALAWKTLAWALAADPAARAAVAALATPPHDAAPVVADAWREIILPTLSRV